MIFALLETWIHNHENSKAGAELYFSEHFFDSEEDMQKYIDLHHSDRNYTFVRVREQESVFYPKLRKSRKQ